MSQLAAIAQGLYYPTDQRVLRLFVEKNVSMRGSSAIEIFDPCVGEGLALFEFARAVKEHLSSYVTVRTTGIEIEEQRAQEAKKIIGTVHLGSFEDFSFVNDSHIIFANVPYDSIKGKRVELDWISKIAQIMSENTRLVLVLPSRFFEGGENHNDMRLCLYQNKLMPIGKTSGYNMQENLLGALKFPEPEYQMFKQHIYVVEKKTWGCELMKSIKVDGVIGESRNKYILGPEEFNANHRYSGYTPDKKYFQAIREESKTYDSIFTDESKVVELFGKPKPQIPITPLMPMRDEILAAAIAGGLFGGIRVGNSVIRGGSTTIVEETERITDDEVTKEIIKTSKLIAHISELSMETGDIVTYNSDAPEFGQKIEEIAIRVKSLMNEMSPSLYRAENDYERLHSNFANVRAPRIKRDGSDDLIITQKQAASTILRGWESTKSVFLMGEMGVGKTITSIAAAVGQIQNRGNDMKQKIVLLVPSKDDLVEKWKMEISNACRDIPHTVVDVETITAVRKAFAIKGITFIVVKESMVKRTSGVKNIYLKKKCFDCGSKDGLVNAVGELPEKDNETLFCMHCGVKYETYVRNGIGKGNPFNSLEKHMDKYYPPRHDKSWEKGEYEKACALVLSHYTTYDKFEKGNAYSSLAEYINDHYAKGYVLVIDECFPGDSLVSTDIGKVQIKDVKVGMNVLSEKNGELIYRPVQKVIKTLLSKHLVKVTHERGSFTCTTDHKIYTNKGLVKAIDLTSEHLVSFSGKIDTGELNHASSNERKNEISSRNMLELRTGISKNMEKSRQQILFYELWKKIFLEKQQRENDQCVHRKGSHKFFQAFQRTNEEKQSNAHAWSEGKDDGESQKSPWSFAAWWKWTFDGSASGFTRSSWKRLVNRILYSNRKSEVDSGAGGHCLSSHEDCNRSGWSESPYFEAKEQGYDKEANAGRFGMESNPYMELPNREGCLGNSKVHSVEYVDPEENYVYDLTVEETHRYFVEDVLVSNCHQMKSGDSARGYASGSLIRGASRVLMMTGTFYNGYASSMYFNLYRCSGSFREGNTYDGVMDFVRLYGLEEEIVKLNRDNIARSWSGYNVKKTVKTKEIPGIHPAMIGLMLPYTVFMKLSDMNTILPPQFEHTLFVDIPNEANSKVSEYLRKVKDKAVTLSRDVFTKHEGTSLLGQYTWAKSGAFDVYPIGDTIESENESFGLEPVNPKSITPKEDALLRIACECKRKGFPLLIYYGQTDRRPIQNRFADQFAKLGMKLSYMPSTVKSRVEFIEKSLADGSDAVICNANLVREGIDLLMFRAIAWYGVTPDAILVNQANARIHRIGKQFPTDVYYLGYNQTYQAAQWLNTSKKVQAMQAMHGDVRAGLAALLGERSMINEIQDSIISYERCDSDLNATDFPETSVFARDAEGEFDKKFKIAEKIMTSEITLEEWKKIHLPAEDKKVKKVKTQFPTVPQLFMF